MAIADIEYVCRNCGDAYASDRFPDPQLCPSCSKLDPWQHKGTCACEICQAEEDGGRGDGTATYGAPRDF